MDEKLINLRDVFRELADIIDEMLNLEIKENEGQDVKKEIESITGRYILKIMELEVLGNL